MKVFRVSVNRPSQNDEERWKQQRSAIVISDSFDEATKKTIAHYNDLNDVDDYFVDDVSVMASDTEGEGAVLLR